MANNSLQTQIAKYGYVTVQSAGITLGLPWLLHTFAGFSEQIAIALGLVTAFVVNFVILRSWVFQSKGSSLKQLLKFSGLSASFRLGEYLAFLILFETLQFHYLATMAVILCFSLVLKFLIQRQYIFR